MQQNAAENCRLTRDVNPASRSMQLLNKQKEFAITEASTVGDVRIVDPAITQPAH